jgi:GntR family transcriptional repressor for pyruvate dehydrogenase complex
MVDASAPANGERSHELVARAIENRILSRAVLPGDILPSETALAAELGVHRSTLREALRSLEQNGLVYREAGRRKLRVGSGPQSADLSRRLVSAMVVQQVTFEELYLAMRALEPATAEAAAKNATAAVLTELDDNLARTRSALNDSDSLTALDIEFHNLVAKAANNRALDLTRRPLSDLFYPAFYGVMSGLNAAERLMTAHESIVAAIRAGDPLVAREWMERHIKDFRRGYQLAKLEMNEPVAPQPVN